MAKESIKPSLRWAVFSRDGFACVYCGRSPPDVSLQCDHVKPESDDGKTVEANLVTSCETCNIGKGVKPLVLVKASDLEKREIGREAAKHFPAVTNAMISAMAAQGDVLTAGGVSIEAASLCMALAAIRVGAEVCSLAPLPTRLGKKRFLAICAAMFDEVDR